MVVSFETWLRRLRNVFALWYWLSLRYAAFLSLSIAVMHAKSSLEIIWDCWYDCQLILFVRISLACCCKTLVAAIISNKSKKKDNISFFVRNFHFHLYSHQFYHPSGMKSNHRHCWPFWGFFFANFGDFHWFRKEEN